MESTLLTGQEHSWLVVGSNGAVGSELTRALLRSSYVNGSQPVDVRVYPRDKYADANLDLALSRSSRNPLRLLFCAGKGGFSLSNASAEQQHQAFEQFCQMLASSVFVDKFIFVSSLGAHCSRLGSPYSHLVHNNEQILTSCFGGRSLILRLPSMYGYNNRKRSYHGVIGIILRNVKVRQPTGIYARLETRRNYLSIRRLANQLVRKHPSGTLLEANGCLNIQSSISLSMFDVCASFFRTVKQRPTLKLMQPSLVDAEHHYPGVVHGAKLILNDSIDEWVSWQWNRFVHLSL